MLEKRQAFTFVWGFTLGDSIALHSCTPASIFVNRDPQNVNPQVAVPPYTIIAYPNQGIPTVDSLGNGPDNMSWTPRFPAGTTILISIVDSLGNSGGVAQKLYTLGSGTSTSCIPSNSDNDFKATIDGASTTLQTCQTLPIRIQGGTKPYTVTIANTNASNAVNITMDAANDYYQWVNKADPNQSLIAAVSDSTGQYAPSVQFFTTAGSTDKTCAGQNNIQSVYGASSSSSTPYTPTTSGSSTTTSAAAADNQDKGGKPLTGAIIGTILALLAIFGIIAYFFFRRRNSRRTQFDGDPTTTTGGGFGMKDYKRGTNMPGNESFLPLHDHDSTPRTPVLGNQTLGSPQTGYGPRRQSNMDYYSSPPTDFSGTTHSYGTSAVGSNQTGPSQSTTSGRTAPSAAAAAAGRPMTKREMMLEDQRRQQEFNGGTQGQSRPESMYPPASSYTVNPFGDNTYPYNPAGNAAPTHSHARSSSFGSNAVLGTVGTTGTPGSYTSPFNPPYNPSHTGTGTASRPSGSQDLTTMSVTAAPAPGRGNQSGMTPAARAKAAEAAQEQQRRGYADDDDDDLLAYTQPRLMLGVTNPDRASVATTNTTASNATATADPYGGTAGHAIAPGAMTPTQVYQHEDAGVVVELPPAYREFSRTPAPGGGPPRL